MTISITRGSGTSGTTANNDGSCSGFSAGTGGDGNVYSGSLSSLGTDFSGGSAISNAGDSAAWSKDDAEYIKVVATLPSGVSNSANGLVTGTHALTFEAQNT